MSWVEDASLNLKLPHYHLVIWFLMAVVNVATERVTIVVEVLNCGWQKIWDCCYTIAVGRNKSGRNSTEAYLGVSVPRDKLNRQLHNHGPTRAR